jgi:outer membrane lipoprotein-sorting protein
VNWARKWRPIVVAAALACLMSSPVSAGSALDRLATAWSDVHDYSVTIDAHEVLRGGSENRTLHYAFRKPMQARLDLVSRGRSVATILWSGGDGVTAYHPGFSFLKIHGNARDRKFTSLRGNGVLTPNLGDIFGCLEQHQGAIVERRGPTIDGEPTDEIALERAHTACADDSDTDRRITLDVIDVSQRGTILLRKRYEGPQLVEKWILRDYRINAGLDDNLSE